MKASRHGLPVRATIFLSLLGVCGCIGGNTSKEIGSEFKDKRAIRSFSVVGADNAWLIPENGRNLMLTTNGGRDWKTVDALSVGTAFDTVGFLDSKRGLAVNSYGDVWQSLDGGLKWVRLTTLKPEDSHEWRFISARSIHFNDQMRAWILETFRLWRTDDAGQTWRDIYSLKDLELHGQPEFVQFVDRDHGWLVTSKAHLLKTEDGGTHWKSVSLSQDIKPKYVHFANDQTGWLISFSITPPYSDVKKTVDGGNTWRSISSLNPKAVIEFASFQGDSEAWLAGRLWTGDPNTSTPLLMHTLDSGQTWQPVQVSEPDSVFHQVEFVDSQRGWLFGESRVYRTVDGGRTWAVVLKFTAA